MKKKETWRYNNRNAPNWTLGKRQKKSTEYEWVMWQPVIKWPQKYVIVIPKEVKWEGRQDKIYLKIMTKIFPNLMKIINWYTRSLMSPKHQSIQEAQYNQII